LVGDLPPLLASRGGIVLSEGGADPGGDNAPLSFPGIGRGIAHEMNAPALPSGAEHLADGGLQPLARVFRGRVPPGMLISAET